MKKFDIKKVREIAIDLPNYQQIYVLDHQNRNRVIKLLYEMGYTTDFESLSKRYKHLPWAVNIRQKRFFTVGSVAVIACAVQQGAIVLKLNELNELTYFENV